MPQLGQELLKPSSQYYTTPGGATEAAKVQATKEASYLSSMDQFYAQLEEMERQFDLTLGLKEKEFGLKEDYFGLAEEEFGFGKEKFGKEFGLKEEYFGLEEEKFEFVKETAEETEELDWYKARTERIGVRGQIDYYEGATEAREERTALDWATLEAEKEYGEQEEEYAYSLLPTPGPQYESPTGERRQTLLPTAPIKSRRGTGAYTGYL